MLSFDSSRDKKISSSEVGLIVLSPIENVLLSLDWNGDSDDDDDDDWVSQFIFIFEATSTSS